jgi:phage shock protein PspC (stress-responsive transcriptional regulator)
MFLTYFGGVCMKKLYRKQEGKIICGVCGGIGDYFGIDPTLIRLVWALLACTGTGVLAYIIAAIIIPEESSVV